MDNIYYDPGKFGLTLLGELDFSSGYYEFDYTAVWSDSSGTLYYLDDSGCSCPSPFEDYNVSDLVETDYDRLNSHLKARLREQNYYTPQYVTMESIINFMERIKNAHHR